MKKIPPYHLYFIDDLPLKVILIQYLWKDSLQVRARFFYYLFVINHFQITNFSLYSEFLNRDRFR